VDRSTRIAVIGAGLGGLTAAGFLQRAGFPVRVYEQAPAFSRIGAGIILSSNVTKVLRRLGIEDALCAAGIKSQSYISRAWDTGETLYEIVFDAAKEQHFGGPYVHIHRGDLHAVLERGVAPGTIAFDHQLVGIEETGDGVRLAFGNGTTAEADIVIGGDGIRSKVREFVVDRSPPDYVGAAAFRAIFPAERLNGFWIPDCTKWWGRDRHCLPYYLTGRRDEVYAIGVVPTPRWEGDNEASIPATRDQYLEAFSGFHPDLQRVLEAVDTVTLWPVYDRERNDRWSRGNLVLLGDACHPTRRDPEPLPGDLRRCSHRVSQLYRDPHFEGRPGSANFYCQYLDGRSDRHRLVLLLRCLHGPASSTRLSKRCLKPSPTR
jgi:6-hydroxynicotinate 3-monooxygenase